MLGGLVFFIKSYLVMFVMLFKFLFEFKISKMVIIKCVVGLNY